MTGEPVPPIAFGGAGPVTGRLVAERVDLDDAFLERLGGACARVDTDLALTAEASRDWWPLAMTWALDGHVPALAAAVARPASVDEVSAVAALCHEARVPLTAAAGRSGVCGGSVPVHGGVVLDLCGLEGIRSFDPVSMVIDVAAGTFGDVLEDRLRQDHGVTLGHWPQSVALSTVGGWLACRSAGQLSNRYGKIEDMVMGLDVVLADGRVIATGGGPRAAVGPDLNQLFVGSEGTLGLITGARLRVRPAPALTRKAAYGFDTFANGLEACRRITQRGLPPAVLRLYDATESDRHFQTGGRNVVLVLDEGDPAVVDASLAIAGEECAAAEALDTGLVDHWLESRNDVAALEALIGRGYVVDTMEVAAPWRALPGIHQAVVDAMAAVPATLAASAHQSHGYPEGACLYFTFAGQPEDKDGYYRQVWDAGTRAVLERGGTLSHHHGVGLNRSRFVAEALGPAFDVLTAVKGALDPHGILNPSKLGLPGPFGPVGWP